jgi:hypothetical protein
MISEDVPSFKIRWVALYLRKRAKAVQRKGHALETLQPMPQHGQPVASLDWQALPRSRGLYWLRSPEQKLYVGKAFDLRQRFQLQFGAPRFDFWGTALHRLEVRYLALPDISDQLLNGNQSRWIACWNPVGNFADFAAR